MRKIISLRAAPGSDLARNPTHLRAHYRAWRRAERDTYAAIALYEELERAYLSADRSVAVMTAEDEAAFVKSARAVQAALAKQEARATLVFATKARNYGEVCLKIAVLLGQARASADMDGFPWPELLGIHRDLVHLSMAAAGHKNRG